jgi:hypothetical protein
VARVRLGRREQGASTARPGCANRREQGARAGLCYGARRREQGYVTARAGLREQARAEPLKARAGLINFLRGARIPGGCPNRPT